MKSSFEGTAFPPELPLDVETASHADEPVPDPAGVAGQPAREAVEAARDEQPLAAELAEQPLAAELAGRTTGLLVTIAETMERLAASSERYHARAEQRESVIDHLRSEVDRLRQGERRSLLRPLLVEICRLRNDLLRQAEDLPGDFDADRARLLLRSYADSIELALEDNGVATFTPENGDQFEPRLHRRVGGEPASDPGLAGHVARVRRGGYLDLDTNTPVAPAEVVLFTGATAGPLESAGSPVERGDRRECGPATHESASATDERKEL
jgi:molecular chaperone GrpE (heat shock protein)